MRRKGERATFNDSRSLSKDRIIMKTSLRSLMLAALLPIAGTACAQSDSSGGGGGDRGGNMTLDQYLSRQAGRITAADTDGDGKVSKAEYLAQMSRGGRGNPERMFDRMDTNHDGFLDKGEITAALTQRFQRMDANDDGVVTPEERMAMRGNRRGGGGGGEAGAGGQDGGAAPNP
jgi:hypothetical protein